MGNRRSLLDVLYSCRVLQKEPFFLTIFFKRLQFNQASNQSIFIDRLNETVNTEHGGH